MTSGRVPGIVLGAVFFVSFCSFAGTNTVYNFLRSDTSPRAAGLGGSFITATNDPNAIFYNPAGVSTMERPMGSIGFFKHLLDINTGYASFASEWKDVGFVGASVLYTNYGSFDRTDDAANNLGTFSAGDLALMLGYSNILDVNLHYGITLKYIHSSIAEYSSSGLAADIGLLYTIPDSRVSFGVSARNIGTQLSTYASLEEDLPLDVAIGGSVVPRGIPLLLNLSFHRLNDDVDNFADRFRAFRVGGEFSLSPSFQLRFGYDNEKRSDLKIGSSSGLAGFSGGVGLIFGDYRVDYALSSLGKVGELHRVSVGAGF
jgi:hypothetical protein